MTALVNRYARNARRLTPLALALVLLLASCGTGAGTDDFKFGTNANTQSDLRIATYTLPAGHVDAAFPVFQFLTDQAVANLSWTLTTGTLPPGMQLTSDGRLVGTPSTTGLYPITVHATDGVREASQALLFSVDAFGLIAVDGLHFNEAWTDASVTLAAAGATGPVDFSLDSDPTFGQLANSQGAIETTFRPGSAAGAQANVVVRATDRNSGQTATVTLAVRANPAAAHIAHFGSSDVWYVDFAQKHGFHAHASDWHACCAETGLRGHGSLGSMGNAADQLADFLARRATLSELNRIFLRNRDGSQGTDGMGISFPMERPDAQFAAPAPGSALPGGSTHYSVLSLYNAVNRGGFLGAAIIDTPNNPNHFNNSAGAEVGELGVFLHTIVDIAVGSYRLDERDLYQNPISTDDMPILRALLHGESTAAFGARAADIEFALSALSRSVAAVSAHEIAHSCGLQHNKLTRPGAIMNYSTMIHPEARYHFLPENLAMLRQALPGPGRYVTADVRAKLAKTRDAQRAFLGGGHGGGVCVCTQQ